MILHCRLATILLVVLCLQSSAWSEEPLDRGTVYRIQPPGHRLVAVPTNEIQVGFIYKYFNSQLSRHVWGIAAEEGGFAYAFGRGTMQPANRFDIRLSTNETQQLLTQQAPGLSKLLERTGRKLFVRLGDADEWEIHPASTIPRLFDQLTGRRWEWHGRRRVAVMHTGGYQWREEGGHYVPATPTLVDDGAVAIDCPCDQ